MVKVRSLPAPIARRPGRSFAPSHVASSISRWRCPRLWPDTFRHSAARAIPCPFTGQTLAAVPALWPDVAVIHVHEADCFGNCRILGTSVADLDLARAARKVIVTCERLIAESEIRRDPTRTVIPFFCVDAVCEVPFGSYPGNMPYEYFSDENHIQAWLQAERDAATHAAFLEEH